MPSKLWRLPSLEPYVLKDEQNCIGMDCFKQNILFHIKIRTNPEYLEDETSQNWIPVGTGIYDIGSGKIHHWNKMAERVDIIF